MARRQDNSLDTPPDQPRESRPMPAARGRAMTKAKPKAKPKAMTWDRLGDPRGAAQALRELLRSRVEQVLAAGQLDKDTADELAKIAAILEKLEGAGYDLKAAALEVGERLAAFAQAREADPGRRAWLADLLESFYSVLAGSQAGHDGGEA